MSLKIKVGMADVWFVLLAFCLNTQAWATPDYVTAWPKQVQVEKPDPVLGDKPFWEHWAYSESFAKRFKGFPADKADPELKGGGLEAMALRIYKKNLWEGLNPNFPEQYACEWDIYFDDSLGIPLMQTPRRFIPPKYPPGVSASYSRLEPFDEKDRLAILKSKPVSANPLSPPLIFADRPLDGRYSAFQLREYHPNLVPGLAVAVMGAQMPCQVTAPKAGTGIHWLSLFGKRPYDKDDLDSTLWRGMQGSWGVRVKTTAFDPGPNPQSKGYFRVPEAFNKAALPKAALVKVMNWCIRQKHSPSDWKTNGQTISWQQLMYRCDEAELNGRILPDPRYHFGKEGLQDTGY